MKAVPRALFLLVFGLQCLDSVHAAALPGLSPRRNQNNNALAGLFGGGLLGGTGLDGGATGGGAVVGGGAGTGGGATDPGTAGTAQAQAATGGTATGIVQAQAAQPQVPASSPDGNDPITQATDGSLILDKTVQVDQLSLRFKISGPANQFTPTSGVPGAASPENAAGTLGLNVLLHGDGADSFDVFPNQAVQKGLMGVVVRTPDVLAADGSVSLKWGGGNGGLQRPDGIPHAKAVNDLIQTVLPQMVAFNKSQVFFTGVSGGSLLLSGFFIPTFMTNYRTGVLLNCGGLPPQTQQGVQLQDINAVMSTTTIHFQSSQKELSDLQPAIPSAITAYETLARNAGLSNAQIDALQTVNNAPNGGHCAFDGQSFDGGVQLMADNFANVIQPGGNGEVPGIGNVKTGVVGNENLQFTGSARQ